MSTMTATITTRYSGTDPSMDANDQSDDKEEKKREYNRLAQREFRRRRKEHLKNLEHAQKEQNSEQSEELERLRYENDELRRENESLREQLYMTSSTTAQLSASLNASSLPYDSRSYSLSPPTTASLSVAGSPPQTMGDMLPMTALSMTSSLTPSIQAYDSSGLSAQPYSMVHPSGLRPSSSSSLDASGFRSSPRSLGPSFQSMSLSPASDSSGSKDVSHGSPSGGQIGTMTAYNIHQARADLLALFQPFYSDVSTISSPEVHLTALFTLCTTLPPSLKPSKAHLDTPHFYGIDLIPSPSLRDRLLTVSSDVSKNFIMELGLLGGEDLGQLTIWGQDPLNEMSWEFSPAILDRWGWLMGRDWVTKSNWWRRQRGVAPLPEW